MRSQSESNISSVGCGDSIAVVIGGLQTLGSAVTSADMVGTV